MNRWSKAGIAALVIAVTALAIWANLPRDPFSSDLSRIGGGKPAVVLAFENHTGPGLGAVELLRSVRADYEPALLFLVADLSVPAGRELSSAHGAANGAVMLFDGDGRHAGTFVPASPDSIRGELAKRLRLNPY